MPVEVSGHGALAKQFDAVHVCFCAASSVIQRQLSPERPSKGSASSHGVVSHDSSRRYWLSSPCILTQRGGGSGTASGNRIVAPAGVRSPICRDFGDLLIGLDRVQRARQHGCVAEVARSDPDRANYQCFLVHTDTELAPQAPFAPAMIPRIPRPFTLGLDPSRVDQQKKRPRPATVRDDGVQSLLTTAQSAEVWDFPVQSGQRQEAFDEAGRLPKRHTEQSLQRWTNFVRQTWIVASLYSA